MSESLLPDFDAVQQRVREADALMLYFGGEDCNVCQIMRPKIRELLQTRYPRIEWQYIDAQGQAEIAAQYSVFSVPTVIAFFDGQESLRRARNFSPGEIGQLLQRPYTLFFE